MLKRIVLVIVLGILSTQSSLPAGGKFVLDFTKPKEIQAAAKWNDADKIVATAFGLGFDGSPSGRRDVRIETTAPVAVGWSWRPTYHINIEASVEPPGEYIFEENKTTFPPGQLYASYSPDAKHWSSWNYLPMQRPRKRSEPEQSFKGAMRVPYSEREAYGALLRKYRRMDVPWVSDEEAAVRWIVGNDPDFFATHLPFIGYVRFLYETSLRGGERLKRLRFSLRYSASGKRLNPRAGNDIDLMRKRRGPWRYRAVGNLGSEQSSDKLSKERPGDGP